jgi:hypothetical protein
MSFGFRFARTRRKAGAPSFGGMLIGMLVFHTICGPYGVFGT